MTQQNLSGSSKGGSGSVMKILLTDTICPHLEHCIMLVKHL